ncbi:nuclear protein DGCR14 [Schizophyllum amplum]|uniref:Nuclear protein DGCR14 n=1 Tax=Schizophyllum amplum TaxID=97359 RepID=A0A550CLL3_9AGAR|nr:nuclear protein DGCR14 [Auriculariopsis ampla]
MATPRQTPVATSTAIIQTNDAAAERSLNRQIVLEEDEYTAALSHIIARDFFPSIHHLDATNDWLSAVEAGDETRIQSTVRRLEDLGATPFTGATPRYHPGSVEDTPRPAKRARLEKAERDKGLHLTLDEFQARFTSEDNSSFTRILDDENTKRREIHGWAFDAQRKATLAIEEGQQKRQLLLEGHATEADGVEGAGVRGKLRIEYSDAPLRGLIESKKREHADDGSGDEAEDQDGDAEQEQESAQPLVKYGESEGNHDEKVLAQKKDTRDPGVQAWKFKARNSLMFPPDADESPYHPKPMDAKPKEKVIKHTNTRLLEQEEAEKSASEPPSPTRSRIDAAIMGAAYHSSSTSDSSSPFKLVPNLPSPTADQLGPARIKELMTWGTLAGTPRILSSASADEPPTPFRIAEPTSREVISRNLSVSASKSLRERDNIMRGVRKAGMPPPNWTTRREREGNLTPAARRLLDRTVGAQRRADAMERASGWGGRAKERDIAQMRWTPTPGRG